MSGVTYALSVCGKHNIENVLAAVLAAVHLGCPVELALTAAQTFSGVGRRLDTLGQTESGIVVIDDFGHNPDKISATLNTLQQYDGRLIVMFQPHGFAPTLQMKDGYIESFVSGLKNTDILLIPEIYYAGGSVTRSISSADLTSAITAQGKTAKFCADRAHVEAEILANAKAGDRIIIMGARDDTLTEFGNNLLEKLA
jgi:UDP-N-acetylmuramate--alanine ligase